MNGLKRRVEAAVKDFWATRSAQDLRQGAGGERDRGGRSAVTGGAHIDGFVRLTRELLVEAGLPKANVYAKDKGVTGTGGGVKLPGYFRATKDWDLLVVAGGHLVATVEFKSIVGSFGNNCNNRVEEALGNATDLLTAYREGAFAPSSKPWLGYFMLMEERPGSKGSLNPVKTREPHFKVLPEFKDASYARRMELLCLRLVRERLYDAACMMLSDREHGSESGAFREPNAEVGFTAFTTSLTAHASAFAKLHSL
jgi:hypothetical protein